MQALVCGTLSYRTFEITHRALSNTRYILHILRGTNNTQNGFLKSHLTAETQILKKPASVVSVFKSQNNCVSSDMYCIFGDRQIRTGSACGVAFMKPRHSSKGTHLIKCIYSRACSSEIIIKNPKRSSKPSSETRLAFKTGR